MPLIKKKNLRVWETIDSKPKTKKKMFDYFLTVSNFIFLLNIYIHKMYLIHYFNVYIEYINMASISIPTCKPTTYCYNI